VVHHDDPPTKTEQKAALAPDASHEDVFNASMDMVRVPDGDTHAVPDRTERPVVIEVAGGGELIVRLSPAEIRAAYPDARLVRYDDNDELIVGE
jgi:hypothetical protein